jgi:hypothetical protein
MWVTHPPRVVVSASRGKGLCVVYERVSSCEPSWKVRDREGALASTRDACAIQSGAIALRVAEHFFDSCVAREDAAQTVLAQRDHSKLNRLLFDRNSWRTLVNQFTDWVCDS